MHTTLDQPHIAALLDELATGAERDDPALIDAARAALYDPATPFDDQDPRLAELLRDAALPVDPPAGRLLYLLARSTAGKLFVEFGTSFGISTIYLAAAARDVGARVISTELDVTKLARARVNLERAGLLDVVELRGGDARKTLRDLPGPVDLAFLDGWKSIYLPVLKVLEPALSEHALVVADNLHLMPALIRPFVEHVRTGGPGGYFTVEVRTGPKDAVAVSVNCKRRTARAAEYRPASA
jgi:predicted O-methyltransferase YrrM